MELYEIVMKLIGPVDPIGDSNVDDKRFKNLTVMIDLVEKLLTDIAYIASNNKDSHEFSVSRAGKYCNEFYNSLMGG